jgi:predicted  nucleic acid-binding Zn-ribbon protein
LIDANKKLSSAESEIKKLKNEEEFKNQEIEYLKKEISTEENNNQEYRETINKLHKKYKNIIENIAHEAGKFKTDAFINKSLLEDKANELDVIN